MLPGSKRKNVHLVGASVLRHPRVVRGQVTCHIFFHSSAKTNTATWRTTQPVLILKRYHLWVQTSAQSSLSQSPTATEIGLLMQLPICRSAASGIFQDSSRRSCGSSAYECGVVLNFTRHTQGRAPVIPIREARAFSRRSHG